LDSSDLGNYNDILHLLGNAHYQLKNYQDAATFLSQYNQRVKTTREEDYQLGFCYLKSNQWDKALGYLERSSRIDDSLGQISLYQIGLCYQNQEKWLPARNAFEKAANRKIHAAIREDALYQFAVISYKIDINPYDESVRHLQIPNQCLRIYQ
jgi:tetratricopeptide (TPR) repeat protein